MSERERLKELAEAWRREAMNLNLKFRDQAPALTVKVDTLNNCADELAKALAQLDG